MALRDQLEFTFSVFLLQDEIWGFFSLHLIKELKSVQTLFQ